MYDHVPEYPVILGNVIELKMRVPVGNWKTL